VLATICRHPMTLTFDLLTLKSAWESHVTRGTPVQSFVFLGLLVFELEPMYATVIRRTDRRTDADHRIMPPRRGHNNDNMQSKYNVPDNVIYGCVPLVWYTACCLKQLAAYQTSSLFTYCTHGEWMKVEQSNTTFSADNSCSGEK